jgi:hypothetical protein
MGGGVEWQGEEKGELVVRKNGKNKVKNEGHAAAEGKG